MVNISQAKVVSEVLSDRSIVWNVEYHEGTLQTAPDEWSGAISGPGIAVIDQPKNVPYTAVLPEMITHVRIRFDTPDGLDYFVDEIKHLREEHGPDTRIVFGFDS